MKSRSVAPSVALFVFAVSTGWATEPMHVGFLWHMHQPVYYPGETITQTDAAGHFSFSVTDVHNQRLGPYTGWPRDAVQSGLGLPHLGAQVSFSGSLIQNLNVLEAAGVNGGQWSNWEAGYKQAAQWDTSLGNPRLDLVNFGFNHPLMPLLDTRDIRMQIRLQKRIHEQTWGPGVPFSKGIFPPETAFSTRIIPALAAEGIEWSIVDSIHLERATEAYPHTNASNLYAPNRADQINPDIAASGGQWVQLNNVWAPSRVAAPFAYRPHQVQYVDPATGAISQIVAVPAARYEGNEDGRGGFGALQYETVMEQYRQLNTDPNHPMFVMLHHDGDNYGGGSDSYYHSNFQNMVNWAQSNPNYDVSTVDDYLERYPVAAGDVVHIENGSWAGADNGDPEFKKWLGDPNGSGWSPDRNSWAVLTAAKNRVFTADDIAPATNLDNILAGVGTPTERAWRHLMAAESSDYWYWDGTEVWDSNVTRGSNLAVAQANQVLTPAALANETTPPSVFIPQRESYNPGGMEWGPNAQPSDFEVWTYAYDVSGLSSVSLKWRVDTDGENPLSSTQNETYAGGAEVGAWNSVAMASIDVTPPANILSPTYRALRYGGMITGQSNALVDYYVEAVDSRGNIARSDIQHVWVGGAVTPPDPPVFVMDGVRDAQSQQIVANGSRHLYAALNGDVLYVASEDAGEGNDVFIYLADTPGALRAANWAKAGQIAGWDAYLADENNNDYESWYDVAAGAAQAATGANGGVLEGTIDLAMEFGALPSAVYLAVGVYATNDGGALVASQQVPASANGNGNIDAIEYFLLQLIASPGDYNRDGDVDNDDLVLWNQTLGSNDLRADGNKDGIVDAGDYVVWRKFNGASGASGVLLTSIDWPANSVPEPAYLLFAAIAPQLLGQRIWRRLEAVSKPGASAPRLIRSAETRKRLVQTVRFETASTHSLMSSAVTGDCPDPRTRSTRTSLPTIV